MKILIITILLVLLICSIKAQTFVGYPKWGIMKVMNEPPVTPTENVIYQGYDMLSIWHTHDVTVLIFDDNGLCTSEIISFYTENAAAAYMRNILNPKCVRLDGNTWSTKNGEYLVRIEYRYVDNTNKLVMKLIR